MAIDKVTTAAIADDAVTNAKVSYNNNQFRNIIINGDMSLAQRGTSTSSITSTGYQTLDRFKTNISSLGTWTQSQSTDVPSGQGFAKSLKMDCTTADASPSASDKLLIQQLIEGQMLQYLKKGTSSAESLTLSFWVKSNKTGTYIANLYDGDNTRQISKSYTISSADTWEKKTLTYAGDTTGTLGNDNAESLTLNFWLASGTDYSSGTLGTSWHTTAANRAVGQVNLGDSTSNEWYITGVQLEVGTAASDFEFLPFDVNLQRCRRYFADFGQWQTMTFGSESNPRREWTVLDTPMRTAPSVTYSDGVGNSGKVSYHSQNYGSGRNDNHTGTVSALYTYTTNGATKIKFNIDSFSGYDGFVNLIKLDAEL